MPWFKAQKNIEPLQKTVYLDDLTDLKNRLSLYHDAQELKSKDKKFHLLYMDLDYFKTIND